MGFKILQGQRPHSPSGHCLHCLTALMENRFPRVHSLLLSCVSKYLLGLTFPPCPAVHRGSTFPGTVGLLLVCPWSCLHPRLSTHYLSAASPWRVTEIIINPPALGQTAADITPRSVNQRKCWQVTWTLQSVCFRQMDCMNQKFTPIPNFAFFHCSLQQHLSHATRTNELLVLY